MRIDIITFEMVSSEINFIAIDIYSHLI